MVAYEPVWAIGTGKTATPALAQEAHAFVRARLAERFGRAADAIRIQYGGSVKPENAAELMAQPDIDGALSAAPALTRRASLRSSASASAARWSSRVTLLLQIVYIVVCLFLIVVVLLQHGKGADIGVSLGAGSSNTVFGARGAGNFLTKLTTASAVLFMVLAFTLARFAADDTAEDLLGVPASDAPADARRDSGARARRPSRAPRPASPAAHRPASRRSRRPRLRRRRPRLPRPLARSRRPPSLRVELAPARSYKHGRFAPPAQVVKLVDTPG